VIFEIVGFQLGVDAFGTAVTGVTSSGSQGLKWWVECDEWFGEGAAVSLRWWEPEFDNG
jgi:hypothetical protein